ncbi:halocyanin domain-containing protein [Halohasta salina]|uniref:halocyanin domain-containing protein n=1 Tax=Halohasta salina TaxID=2961621 RepID=UPI0020A5E005|nr:halocyanin domain-containing protein [Halohasta salina]
MTDTSRYDRRTVVRAIGGSTLAVGLAGCAGSEPTADDEPTDESTDDGDADADTGGDGDADAGGDADESVPDAVDSYLSDNDARGYDGAAVDATGQDTVTVSVGAGEIGLAFDPAAVRVDAGTTIVWEWTGEGGDHNVVAADESDFDVSPQEELIADAGHTTEETFDEAGNFLYLCEPHVGNGKVGAVIVE